jgi:hypothetical protein
MLGQFLGWKVHTSFWNWYPTNFWRSDGPELVAQKTWPTQLELYVKYLLPFPNLFLKEKNETAQCDLHDKGKADGAILDLLPEPPSS